MGKPREYSINGSVRGSTHFGVVQAATAEEAIKKAQGELEIGVSFCHQCSAGCEDPEVVILSAEAQLPDGGYDTAEEDYEAHPDVAALAALRSHPDCSGFVEMLSNALDPQDEHAEFGELLLKLLRGSNG
jgi:hypothetical protein